MTRQDLSRIGAAALALVLLVVGLGLVLRADLNASARRALDEQATALNALASDAVDPRTGAPFADAAGFIEVFIASHTSGRGQLVVGGAAGELGQALGSGALAWQELPPAAREQVTAPGSSGRERFAGVGTLSWATHPVQVGASTDQVTLVHFHRTDQDDLRRHLLLVTALAVVALAVTALLSRALAARSSPRPGAAEQEALAALAAEQEYSADIIHIVRTGLALGEVERLERAVSAMVVLNRARQPDFVRPRPVAADDLVRDAVVRWTEALGPHSPQRVVLHDVAAATIPVDVARIDRALDEVVCNAVEACRDGGLVEVASVVAGPDLVIEVTDNGVGIPDGEHHQVFDRFVRAGNARPDTLDPAAGSGLGLCVARTIIEAHGGSIELAPRRFGGTQVLVRLPLG
ncbi:sensor histidine kinase [Propionibacteriaceae bacterium Y1923]|uniref:sensor histidine kinase n=1 Tax=Aestuariimicrobium sp. Y1814 TaxID=3418742 RepID=UPI003C23890F